MNLISLPEEILIIILRKLDFRSMYNVYETCMRLRHMVCLQAVLQVCDLSLNVMATAKTLKLNFLLDVSSHLKELNLSGVPDLTKTSLLPAIKKMKSLQSLNISYTNLNISDLLEMHCMCPSILNVTINFEFRRFPSVKLPPHTMQECQELFKKFKNVHFVGSPNNLLYSKLPLCILQKAKLHTLKFTITECELAAYENEECNEMVQFNNFNIYLVNWKPGTFSYFNGPFLYSMIEYRCYEFIVIIRLDFNRCNVYVSSIFHNFFSSNFNIKEECIKELKDTVLSENTIIMIWNRETTTFDDIFFRNLFKKIKPLFPYYFSSIDDENPVPDKYDWYYAVPVIQERQEKDTQVSLFKKRRIARSSLFLNYDAKFKNKEKVQLTVKFSDNVYNNPITLTDKCNYLKKITYLSLNGPVRYDRDFFDILFKCCDKLITLNIDSSFTISHLLFRSIGTSRTLKNLRYSDRLNSFNNLFSHISKCKSIENIHINNVFSNIDNVSDPIEIFEKCDNLYSIVLFAHMSENTKTKTINMFKKAKMNYKRYHVNIEINNNRFRYDPFIGVFNLCAIKPL